MQRADPPYSSSIPSFQLASSETSFSCRSTTRGPFSFLSAQVCYCFLTGLSLITDLFPNQLPWLNVATRAFYSLPYLHDAADTDADAVLLPFPLAGCCSSPQSQPELHRNALPPLNLERWYQDIMAAGEPQPCPPPLPAKSFSARRQGQVNSSLFLPVSPDNTLSHSPESTVSPDTTIHSLVKRRPSKRKEPYSATNCWDIQGL